VRGNAIRDLAALNKVEMLPWDEWGRMRLSYEGETGPELDTLIDEVADACASDDRSLIEHMYLAEDLSVPRSSCAAKPNGSHRSVAASRLAARSQRTTSSWPRTAPTSP